MRLLLVEDDLKLANVLRQGLQENGYAVDHVVAGDDALELLSLEPYDLAILDWMLPVVSGLEVCRTMRGRGSAVPVLMLTARDSVEDRVEGLDVGADDYLVKPFALKELLARLRALLRRREPSSRDPVLKVGLLALDPRTREVTEDSVPLNLTNKEFSLLEYLMHNPGRVLTRDQISAHIWEYEFTAMSNVVDVYIGALRRKLRDSGIIRTVRGVGYQLLSESP